MEDSGLEQMTEETEFSEDGQDLPSKDVFAEDAIYDSDHHAGTKTPANATASDMENFIEGGVIRTLDGELAGDEFAQDAMNYQILLGKIDRLLDSLTLDA